MSESWSGKKEKEDSETGTPITESKDHSREAIDMEYLG